MGSAELQGPENPTPEETEQPWGKLVPCISTLDSIVLKKESTKIGRSINCDIIIDREVCSTPISKVHCVFKKEPLDGNVYIIDLSKNGTFVNGEKIGRNKKRILKDYDKIIMCNDSYGYTFQVISMEELPDTLTLGSSLMSPMGMQIVNVPMWGRLVSCLLHLRSVDLCNHSLKVGRSSLCDVVVDNINPRIKRTFSKEHFVITRDHESSITCIKDLSNGGTYLNGSLIGKNKRIILQHEDRIAIGSKRVVVYVYKAVVSSSVSYLPPQLMKKYEVSTVLGKGGCGEVRLAYGKRTLKRYAIKKILKGRSTASQMFRLNHPSKIETEIQILGALSHPFIIKTKEVVEHENEVFLVLEYMEGGELNNRISLNVTESNVKFLFYQMVLAVQFLHSKGITHRDLKPENVLLASHDIETLIKVSDFGLSKITEEDDMMRTICGTLQYIAPEVLNSDIPEYDKQVDVWSLGVILFYMLSKRLPFQSPTRDVLMKVIIKGTYNMDDLAWSGVSYFAKDLVQRMLMVNPQKRITISEMLLHPWLSEDPSIQYRVNLLMQNQTSSDFYEDRNDLTPPSEENHAISPSTSDEVLPPPKRVRLSSSDEST